MFRINAGVVGDSGLHGLWLVYISIGLVMADMGFALTASHLEKRQVTKRFCPFRSVPR
ncbi:hypothetical protein EMIT0P44_20001 [Pseudomonas sp. IT-P44]